MSNSRRPRRRLYRRRLLLLVGLGTVGAALALQQRVEQHPVFRVEVIRLAECPDSLRETAARTLDQLLGKTFFEALAMADGLRAELAELPEVRDASLVCRPPNSVEVVLHPRLPSLAVYHPSGWLAIDDPGVIVRVTPRPEPDLPLVYGLRAPAPRPGGKVVGEALAAVREARDAVHQVLGATPRRVAIEPNGALRVRTADDDLVLLGRPVELREKLLCFVALRNRLGGAAEYFDVTTPAAPAWRPRSG